MSIRTNSRVRTTMKSFLDAIPHKRGEWKSSDILWRRESERNPWPERNLFRTIASMNFCFIWPKIDKMASKNVAKLKKKKKRREKRQCWKIDVQRFSASFYIGIREFGDIFFSLSLSSLIVFLILLLIYEVTDIVIVNAIVFVKLLNSFEHCQ